MRTRRRARPATPPGETPRAPAIVSRLAELLRQGRGEAATVARAAGVVDEQAASQLLAWLPRAPRTTPVPLLRLAWYVACAIRPVTTELNATHYEWAGSTLRSLFGAAKPIAETWAFFSGPSKPARIAGTGASSGMTMEELVAAAPQVLGPAGADPENRRQKYFFVKFLDPSDFPPFAYVGFDPVSVGRLRDSLERERGIPFPSPAAFEQAFKRVFADLLWEDRRTLPQLARLIRPQVRSRRQFERFKAAYKRWAITQASTDWGGRNALDLTPFVAQAQRKTAEACLRRQCEARRAIVSLMHRIDYEPGQAILIETPTLHAIAGLSLQVHPRAPGNFQPKDELWIYQELALPRGKTGWILVEPQRTFDRTESGADFFTPFAWEEAGAQGALGFRKSISRAYLNRFIALMDATPHPKRHFLRTAQPMAGPEAGARGRARWYRVVEEPGWPYFFVRELRFGGPGQSVTPLAHHSFIELHVTRGRVQVLLERRGVRPYSFIVGPARPVFLPATLPYDTIRYRAGGTADLFFFSRSPAPRSAPRPTPSSRPSRGLRRP